MKIAELRARTGNVDLEADVVEVSSPRTFNKFGKEGRVANATIRDESGSVILTLWNDQIDQVNVGDRIKISKGWVSEWQGENQLSTGKFGSLEVIGKTADLPQVVSSRPAEPEGVEGAKPVRYDEARDDNPSDDDMGSDAEEEEF